MNETNDGNRIVVIVSEIESWYLAGLDTQLCREFGLPVITSTDNVTKEQFKNAIPKRFESRIDFMVELLKNYLIETAKEKNSSFGYFIKKFDC